MTLTSTGCTMSHNPAVGPCSDCTSSTLFACTSICYTTRGKARPSARLAVAEVYRGAGAAAARVACKGQEGILLSTGLSFLLQPALYFSPLSILVRSWERVGVGHRPRYRYRESCKVLSFPTVPSLQANSNAFPRSCVCVFKAPRTYTPVLGALASPLGTR